MPLQTSDLDYTKKYSRKKEIQHYGIILSKKSSKSNIVQHSGYQNIRIFPNISQTKWEIFGNN